MNSNHFHQTLNIKNIVFDLGGVLLTFQPEEFLPRIVDDPMDCQWCYHNIVKGPHWAELDRGVLTIEEVKNNYIKRAPERQKSIEQMFERWLEGFLPIQPNLDLLIALKNKGYRIFLLSNFIKEYFELVQKRHEFFSLFDGMAVSYQMKTIKPEPEMYQQTIGRFSLTSTNAVFIDDMQKNVEASIKAGLPAIRFILPSQLQNDLKQMNVSW